MSSRPIVRWAWRMFRREWRQQLAVLVLMTVAVAGAVAGAAMATSASTHRGVMGDAKALIRIDATDEARAQAALASARRQWGEGEVVRHAAATVPGSPTKLDVRSQDPTGRYGHSMLALRSGRYPTTAGEVALTDKAAGLLDADIGDTVVLDGAPRTVVGRVENPNDLHDEFALLSGDAGAPADSYTVLVGTTRPTSGNVPRAEGATRGNGTESPPVNEVPLQVQIAGDDASQVVAFVLIVNTLAMALVCLIAAAGFVVVAQRRQRQLGLLAAIGATDRHLRLVMLVNGALVGVVSAVAGGALGLVGWAIGQPAVETAVSHRVDTFALPWGLIAECLALAVVAATAAAWWPARTMARLPVMAALSRRPVPPAPVHRSVAVAILAGGLGIASVIYADPDHSGHVRPLFLIGGIVLLIIGMVLLAPAAIRLAAAPAARLPFAVRLALRDLARHQARAAAALAAITLGLGISVFIVGLSAASVNGAAEGNLSSGQLLVRAFPDHELPAGSQSDADRAALDAQATRIAAAVPGATIIGLSVAVDPQAAEKGLREPINLARQTSPHSYRDAGPLYVGTPEVLGALGIDPRSIPAGTQLVTSLEGADLRLLDIIVRREPGALVQHKVDLPAYASAPSSLVTQSAMDAAGWVAVRSGWFVQAPHALTSSEVAAARHAAAAVGLTVEARDSQDDLALLRTIATGVGVVLALAIVALTLGLLRGEAAQDLRTLAATGARARTRRALTATSAGVLGLVGAVMAVAGAYAAMAAGFRSHLDKLVPLPVPQLAALLVGLPVLAAATGWLLSGREPLGIARQALD